jgi:energy-coupling factor transport system ATP-binding protein
VAIASVVAMRPRILVLDEPTTGQDHQTTDRVADVIAGLAGDGVGIVCVSHDMRFLAGAASRMVVLADGRVVAEGAPRDVFGDLAALEAAGLAPPQVTRLALALPGLVTGPLPLTVQEMVRAFTQGSPATETGR